MRFKDEGVSIFTTIGVLALIPVLATFSGCILKTLWGWFIVPLGVMPLSLPQAIGIGILVSLFKTNVTEEKLTKQIIANLTYLTVALLYGYVAHLCM